MTLSIGLDPFPEVSTAGCYPGWALLFPDVVWWLLETVLMLGLYRRRMKPRRVGTAAWIAVVWLLASAARFTPQILAIAAR